MSACACDAILMGMGGSRATGGSWYQDPLVPMSAKNSKSSHELPKPPIPRQALGMSSGCTHPHLVVAVKFGFDTRRRASSGFVPQKQPLGRVPTKIDACCGRMRVGINSGQIPWRVLQLYTLGYDRTLGLLAGAPRAAVARCRSQGVGPCLHPFSFTKSEPH